MKVIIHINIMILHVYYISRKKKNIHNDEKLKFRKQPKKIHYCSRNKIILIILNILNQSIQNNKATANKIHSIICFKKFSHNSRNR